MKTQPPTPPDITTFTKRHTTNNRCFAAHCRSHRKSPRRIQGTSAPVHHPLGSTKVLKNLSAARDSNCISAFSLSPFPRDIGEKTRRGDTVGAGR